MIDLYICLCYTEMPEIRKEQEVPGGKFDYNMNRFLLLEGKQ